MTALATRFPRLTHMVIAAVSWWLFAAAFPPVGATPLALFGLVPWLIAIRVLPERGFAHGFVLGNAIYAATLLAWVMSPVMGWGGPAYVVALSGAYILLAWPLVPILRRVALRGGFPLWLLLPPLFTAHDFLREEFIGGVSWHHPAYALAGWTSLIQVADWGRMAPVTFWIWCCNVSIADVVLAYGRGLPRRGPLVRLGITAAIGLAFIGYGRMRMATIDAELREGPAIVGIQPNVSQDDKLFGRDRRAVFERFKKLIAEGLKQEPGAMLVVGSETLFAIDERKSGARLPSLDRFLHGIRRDTQRSFGEELLDTTAGSTHAGAMHYLLGFNRYDAMPPGEYDEAGRGIRSRNSAMYVRETNGRYALVDAYDKRELVPGGEMLPARWFTWKRDALRNSLEDLVGYVPSMTAGTGPLLAELPDGSRFAVNICFELVFPDMLAADRQAGADFFVNISNDAWYDDTAEQDIVHAMVRFRAIECRSSIFRVSNTGISTLIDPMGRELAVVAGNGRRKAVQGVLAARVPVGADAPFAAKHGDLAGWSLVVWTALTVLAATVFNWRQGTDLGFCRTP